MTFPRVPSHCISAVNQRKWMKDMPIPHLAKESTGAEAFLLSKPTVTINQKYGRHWESQEETAGSSESQRWGVITGTQRALLSYRRLMNWISQTHTVRTNSSTNYRPNHHRLRSLLKAFSKELTSECFIMIWKKKKTIV